MNMLFALLFFGRVMQTYYEGIPITDDNILTWTTPNRVCDTVVRSYTRCLVGAELTKEALEDIEYNSWLWEVVYDPMICDPKDPENIKAWWCAPEINIRCCMCDVPEGNTPCDVFVENVCRVLFMSNTQFQLNFYSRDYK
jgi:hypothetical protein